MKINHYVLLLLLCFIHINSNVHTNKMRILFVLDKFPWYTKTIIVNQIIGLLDLGHHVAIYARTKRKSDKIDSIIYEYDLLSKVYYEHFPPDINTYDIVICQYGDEGKRFASIKNKLQFKGKLVTCIRGGDITNINKIKNGAYNELFKCGDLFLPVCEYFKSQLISLGCKPSKIQVLHSAIDCSEFSFKECKLNSGELVRFVSVGRLDEEKGHAYVIKALGNLARKIPKFNFEYYIVGDGNTKKDLEFLARKLKIHDRVKFLGWMNQTGVIQVLRKSHIFILHSITPTRGSQEGIPNALKEAMAMGLPVISTYHSGIPELIEHGVSGFLVHERDQQALEKHIEYLIQHPEKWFKMGMEGRKKIENEFEKNKVNKKFFELIKNICQNRTQDCLDDKSQVQDFFDDEARVQNCLENGHEEHLHVNEENCLENVSEGSIVL